MSDQALREHVNYLLQSGGAWERGRIEIPKTFSDLITQPIQKPSFLQLCEAARHPHRDNPDFIVTAFEGASFRFPPRLRQSLEISRVDLL